MISCHTKIVKFPHCVYIVDYQVWFSYRPHSQEWTLSSGGSFHQKWGCFLGPQTSWPRNGLSGLCIYWRLMYRVGAVCGGQSNSSLEVWWVRRRKARYSQSPAFTIFAKKFIVSWIEVLKLLYGPFPWKMSLSPLAAYTAKQRFDCTYRW